MGVGIVSFLFLDRWLQRTHHLRILPLPVPVAAVYPLWLGLPGIWSRFLLVLPLIFLQAVIWPISKAQSLASAPGKGGHSVGCAITVWLCAVQCYFCLWSGAI